MAATRGLSYRRCRAKPFAVASLIALACLISVFYPVVALAQAPRVSISGLVDHVTAFTRNVSIVDLNTTRRSDAEWYSRSRFASTVVTGVGTTNFVFAFEIDETWGQTGDKGKAGLCGASAVNANGALGTVCSSPQRFGMTAGWDLNTDTQGVIEIKWAYTEFDVPVIPLKTRLRLGAQPFEDTLKIGVLATGDFAGANLMTIVNPQLAFRLTYAAIEEASTGPRDGFVRGEDYALIASAVVTPVRNVELRPIYALLSADGVTSVFARQPRGGLGVGAAVFPTTPTSAHETRHTVGVDGRWRGGALSVEPTVFYQWGAREFVVPAGIVGVPNGGTFREQSRSAWLIDVRSNWYVGALLLDGAVVYTTGNRASQDIRDARRPLRYFEPIDTDTGFYFGMAEIFGLGVDYASLLYAAAAGLSPAVAIGYDKYGLMRLGARATYAVAVDLALRTAVTQSWTAEAVDTRGFLTGGTGITPSASGAPGRERNLGTEVDLGLQYRFAPNIYMDVGVGWLFSGRALATATSTHVTTGIPTSNRHPHDAQVVATRVRFLF